MHYPAVPSRPPTAPHSTACARRWGSHRCSTAGSARAPRAPGFAAPAPPAPRRPSSTCPPQSQSASLARPRAAGNARALTSRLVPALTLLVRLARWTAARTGAIIPRRSGSRSLPAPLPAAPGPSRPSLLSSSADGSPSVWLGVNLNPHPIHYPRSASRPSLLLTRVAPWPQMAKARMNKPILSSKQRLVTARMVRANNAAI